MGSNPTLSAIPSNAEDVADIQLLADLDRHSVSFLVRDAIARASGYLNLKQYRQSVRDFDKVLELNRLQQSD